MLAPSLSGVDQVGRSGGLIQTRRLTCEVASLDRAGGSAAPYLSLESAEEALPGPLRPARPGRSHRAAQTAQQTQHLRLYSSLYCLMGRAASLAVLRGGGPRTPGGVLVSPAVRSASSGPRARAWRRPGPASPGAKASRSPQSCPHLDLNPGSEAGGGAVGESSA